MPLNLAMILSEAARSRPGDSALVLGETHMSFAELESAANRLASGLRSGGLQQGDAVTVVLPNVPEYVISYFGVLKAGGVVVPLSGLLKAREIAHCIQDSGARMLITWADFAPESLRAAELVGGLDTYVVAASAAAGPSGGDFADLLATDAGGFVAAATEAENTAVILYTSGTTGAPKGAELSHLNMLLNCQLSGEAFRVKRTDRFLAVLPLSHAFGQSCVMNAAIRFGAGLSLLPRFDPVRALEAIERDRVTILEAVPTMFLALTEAGRERHFDTSSLRYCLTGGSSMPRDGHLDFEKTFGIRLVEGYGLSEAAGMAMVQYWPHRRRLGSIGQRIWGEEAEVVDDAGTVLPAGKDHVGELRIRGPHVMKGYRNNPEATDETVRDAWLYTGDLAYRDRDGYFFLVERKKDMIIRGGYKVYPREVEDVLRSHPAVAEVAVIGVAHPRLGEEVKAIVILTPGQTASHDELVAYCRERVAAYRYPRLIEVRDSLPKGPTGKVLKKDLR